MGYKIDVLPHCVGKKKQSMRIRLRSHKTIGPQAPEREVAYCFGPVCNPSTRRFSVLHWFFLVWLVTREHNSHKRRETLASQKHWHLLLSMCLYPSIGIFGFFSRGIFTERIKHDFAISNHSLILQSPWLTALNSTGLCKKQVLGNKNFP